MSFLKADPSKKAFDDERIRSFESGGRHRHRYDYFDWRPFDGNGYIKSFYDVKTADGKIIEFCQPNAGVMRKGDLRFDGTSGVMVRLSSSMPY
uniref:Uncharacterized protein n=1 Tax=Burkholderia phage vB_BgluM-SURPRISE13 TaxID=3159457 RepID=A0AAU7PGY8_9VIRU